MSGSPNSVEACTSVYLRVQKPMAHTPRWAGYDYLRKSGFLSGAQRRKHCCLPETERNPIFPGRVALSGPRLAWRCWLLCLGLSVKDCLLSSDLHRSEEHTSELQSRQ